MEAGVGKTSKIILPLPRVARWRHSRRGSLHRIRSPSAAPRRWSGWWRSRRALSLPAARRAFSPWWRRWAT